MSVRQIGHAERQLLRDKIVLPCLIRMLDKQREEVEASRHLLKRLYLELTNILILRAEAELSQVLMRLQRAGVKTWPEERQEHELCCKYAYRGYDGSYCLMREAVKAEIRQRLKDYMRDLIGSFPAGAAGAVEYDAPDTITIRT